MSKAIDTMSDRCNNPEIGALLHAWELGILDDEDTRRFEQHLLACSVCAQQAEAFAETAQLLRSDEDLRQSVSDSARHTSPIEVGTRSWWRRYFWPAETPLMIRPAVTLTLVLLLLYPAWRGLQTDSVTNIRTVPSVSLYPSRSADALTAVAGPDDDVLISFVFEGATPDRIYELSIQSRDGKDIFREPAYRGFDRFGSGFVILPASLSPDGQYVLTVVDPRISGPQARQVYNFSIRRS